MHHEQQEPTLKDMVEKMAIDNLKFKQEREAHNKYFEAQMAQIRSSRVQLGSQSYDDLSYEQVINPPVDINIFELAVDMEFYSTEPMSTIVQESQVVEEYGKENEVVAHIVLAKLKVESISVASGMTLDIIIVLVGP